MLYEMAQATKVIIYSVFSKIKKKKPTLKLKLKNYGCSVHGWKGIYLYIFTWLHWFNISCFKKNKLKL